MKTTTIRASRTPLTMACPASRIPPAVCTEADDAAARLGSAAHEATVDTVDLVAASWRVPRDELREMVYSMKYLWENHVLQWLPDPQREVQMEAGRLTGRADILSVLQPFGRPMQVRVGDWKTGRVDSDHDDQLRAYCWLALQRHPEADRAFGLVLRVRARTVDGMEYTRAELDAWYDRLVWAMDGPEVYRPGPHCGHCPRAWECPARREMMDACCDILERRGAIGGTADLYDAAKSMEGIVEAALALVRTQVQMCGPLQLGDGRMLRMVEATRKTIQAAPATPVLQANFSLDDVLKMCTLSTESLRKAVYAIAAPRRKAADFKQAMEALASAGAVSTTTFEKLEVTRGENPTTNDGTNDGGDAAD